LAIGIKKRLRDLARREQTAQFPIEFLTLAQHFRKPHDRRVRVLDNVP